MNKKFRNITGKRFGKLVVLKRGENDKSGHTRWLCQCDCGSAPKLIYTDALINNKTTSCGCYNKQFVANIGRLNKKYNNYDLDGDYGIGYTNDGHEFYFDKEDYCKINQYCWYKDKNGYIATIKDRKIIYQHRLIMNAIDDDSYDIDHIRHKTNDNRKSQLRIVTHSQNLQNRIIPQNNTSGHIGVSWDKHRGKWIAYINVNQKRIRLGGFCDISDAIIARENAEKQYFGEYRNLEDI